MPERPVTPVPEKMIRQLVAPDHSLGFYSEMVSMESTRYQAMAPLKRGTLYSTGIGTDQRVIDAFPALYFCKEIVPLGSTVINSMPQDKYCIWVWSSSPDAESSYNSAVEYLGDAIANPAYTRVYKIRRSVYETTPAIALGTPLTALIAIRVTASGSGYSTATVGISGGGGSGATAEAVLNASGGVSEIIITAEGTGYTSAPTIAITGDGTGATAIGVIQSQSAVLTSQRKRELPDSDPLSNEFVEITRVWELLPGPLLPYTRFSDDLGAISGTRRAVVWANQTATKTATGSVSYEAREGSSYVAWEISETWSNGTGVGGNPVYPTGISDPYDNTRGPIHRTVQVTSDVSSTASLVVAGGIATLTQYEAYKDNPYLRLKIVETWAVPAVALPSESVNEDGTTTVTTRTMALRSAITEGETVAGGFWTKTSAEAYSDTISWKITEVRPLPGNAITSTRIAEDGTVISVVKTLKQASTITSSDAFLTSTHKEAVSNLVAWEVVESRPSFPTLYDYDIDPETGQTILTSYQVVDAATAGTATSSSGVITRYKHIDKWRSMKIIETYSTPANYDEQRFGAQQFPTLWDGAYVWTAECGAFATGFRGGFSAMVNMRTTTSFTISKQTFDGLTLIPKTLIMGKGVQLPSDMLMDSGTFIYSGTCSGSVSFGASDPDYTTYQTLIGTEQLITGESVLTKSGLYRNTELYVKML